MYIKIMVKIFTNLYSYVINVGSILNLMAYFAALGVSLENSYLHVGAFASRAILMIAKRTPGIAVHVKITV